MEPHLASKADRSQGHGEGQPAVCRDGFVDRADMVAVARSATGVGPLAQRLPTLLAVVARRRVVAAFRGVGRRSRLRLSDHRLDHHPGASARHGKKGGPEDRAIGRSRGGLTTKFRVAVDAPGTPVRFIVTPGERNDDPGRGADRRLAGRAHPGQQGLRRQSLPRHHRRHRRDRGHPGQQSPRPCLDPRTPPLQGAQPGPELIVKLKHLRRIATRYEQATRAYLAIVHLAAAVIWSR